MNFSFWFRATITSVLTLGILVDAQGTNISPGITWDVQKIVWDPVLETCKHIEKEQTKLIMEVVDMAKNALELLQDWENGTLEQKTKSRLKRNYHFFFNIGGENFYNFQARREQVSYALGVISKIESEGNIYIMCTDEKIIHTDPSGYQYKFWPHGESSWVQPGEIVCSTEKVYGYTARWPRNPQSPRYIVLCPSKRPLSIEEVKDKIFEGQSLNDSYGLSTALFHELLHATIDYMRSGKGPDGEHHGVEGTSLIRDTFAPENPDSLAMFALACKLDQWKWPDGKAKAIPNEPMTTVEPVTSTNL